MLHLQGAGPAAGMQTCSPAIPAKSKKSERRNPNMNYTFRDTQTPQRQFEISIAGKFLVVVRSGMEGVADRMRTRCQHGEREHTMPVKMSTELQCNPLTHSTNVLPCFSDYNAHLKSFHFLKNAPYNPVGLCINPGCAY